MWNWFLKVISRSTIGNWRLPLPYLILVCTLSLLTSCGGATRSMKEKPIVVDFKPGGETEKLIATEVIPLNNCGGNSKLGVDVERSREFSYVATDKNGQELGGEFYFLTTALQREYSFEQGRKEAQTYTLHLEVEANSQVEYTIVWKEVWVSGYADVSGDAGREEVPYKIRQGLTFTIEEVKEIDCDKRPLKLFWHPDRKDNITIATNEGEAAQLGSGYQFIRVEGYIFPTQKPGTVPLKLYWHPERQDNVTVTVGEGEQAQLTSGYTFVRIEGYIFPAD